MRSWRVEDTGPGLYIGSSLSLWWFPFQGSVPGFSGWDLFLMESWANVSHWFAHLTSPWLAGTSVDPLKPTTSFFLLIFFHHIFHQHLLKLPSQSASVGETPQAPLWNLRCEHTAPQCTLASHHRAGRNFCIPLGRSGKANLTPSFLSMLWYCHSALSGPLPLRLAYPMQLQSPPQFIVKDTITCCCLWLPFNLFPLTGFETGRDMCLAARFFLPTL